MRISDSKRIKESRWRSYPEVLLYLFCYFLLTKMTIPGSVQCFYGSPQQMWIPFGCRTLHAL